LRPVVARVDWDRAKTHGENMMDFDIAVKMHVYRTIAATTRAPTIAQVAQTLECTVEEVEEAFQRLFKKRLLVLEPDTSEIRMAPPFSAVETSFRVLVDGESYFANCVWDALGVAAALKRDVDVAATCGDCGQPMSMQVRRGAVVPEPWAVHFAVPAAHWWDDIVFT